MSQIYQLDDEGNYGLCSESSDIVSDHKSIDIRDNFVGAEHVSDNYEESDFKNTALKIVKSN